MQSANLANYIDEKNIYNSYGIICVDLWPEQPILKKVPDFSLTYHSIGQGT